MAVFVEHPSYWIMPRVLVLALMAGLSIAGHRDPEPYMRSLIYYADEFGNGEN